MRWAAYGLFAYALVNFFVSIAIGSDLPLRAFSGHWMAFYGMAFATLYSTLHLRCADGEQPQR
jgi:hypothetical protein